MTFLLAAKNFCICNHQSLVGGPNQASCKIWDVCECQIGRWWSRGGKNKVAEWYTKTLKSSRDLHLRQVLDEWVARIGTSALIIEGLVGDFLYPRHVNLQSKVGRRYQASIPYAADHLNFQRIVHMR